MIEDNGKTGLNHDRIQDPLEIVQAKEEAVADCIFIVQDAAIHGTKDLCPVPANPTNQEETHGEEVLESESARIERLGRERPTKFKSFGEELAFCYSIIASQFMAVCP